MRKAVVMIMTLALLMVLSLMVLRSSTVTESYLSDMSENVYNAQLNRTFLDMTKLIRNSTTSIKDQEAFALVLKVPFAFFDEKSDIKVVLSLSSAAGKLNINKIFFEDGRVNEIFYDLLYSFMRDYELSDPLFLLSLILDMVDDDSKERAFGSEIAHSENPSIKDGGITNKKAFEKILKHYAKSSHDANAFKPPWYEVITFSGDSVDFNYLNGKIKTILQRDYDISPSTNKELIEGKDDLFLSKAQSKILDALDVRYYVPRLLCEMDFAYMDRSQSIRFIYDLETRRISGIETIF